MTEDRDLHCGIHYFSIINFLYYSPGFLGFSVLLRSTLRKLGTFSVASIRKTLFLSENDFLQFLKTFTSGWLKFQLP